MHLVDDGVLVPVGLRGARELFHVVLESKSHARFATAEWPRGVRDAGVTPAAPTNGQQRAGSDRTILPECGARSLIRPQQHDGEPATGYVPRSAGATGWCSMPVSNTRVHAVPLPSFGSLNDTGCRSRVEQHQQRVADDRLAALVHLVDGDAAQPHAQAAHVRGIPPLVGHLAAGRVEPGESFTSAPRSGRPWKYRAAAAPAASGGAQSTSA